VADRRLVAAATAFILALVLAGAALVALGLRGAQAPSSVVIAVPAPPPEQAATGEAASAQTADPDAVDEAAPAAAELEDAPAPIAEPAPGSERAAATEAAPSPPQRLVVVATGVAWNEDLAAAAAFRLPSAVAFALPADLPAAVERLDRWRQAGRTVAVRFDWRPAETAAGDAVPLEAGPGVQAGRMEAQWAALEAAAGAVVVEPHAAQALAPVARRLAASRGAPVLLASAAPAPPPEAWRLDAGLLGERALDEALARVVEGTSAGDTLVLLVEVYPALLDRLAAWLRELDDRGIALVPLDRLGEDRG